MHWNAGTGGSTISNGQGLVIRGHAHVRAALVPAAPLVLKRALPVPSLDSVLAPQNWCGTCAHCKSKDDLKR